MGVSEGVSYPTITVILTHWIPVKERALALSFAWGGSSLATAMTMGFSPAFVVAFSWQWLFYASGILGFIWYIFWYFIGADKPETHPTISTEELNYIKNNTPVMNKTVDGAIPFKLIFTSLPVYAILIAHFATTWNAYVLLTWMPSFYHDEYQIDFKALGFITALPYIVHFIVGAITGRVSDTLIKRGIRIVYIRKACHFFGLIGSSILFFFITKTSLNVSIAFLTIGYGFGGIGMSGFGPNMIDILPEFSGMLMGISNTIGTLPGIVGVSLTGYILDQTHKNWQIVFDIMSIINLLSIVVFLLFANDKRLLQQQQVN